MQVFADLKSGEHPSKFASQQTYHQPFLISTQAQKTQSNLFFTSQSLIVNSTEKVIGCFWAVGTVQKNLLVTKMYFIWVSLNFAWKYYYWGKHFYPLLRRACLFLCSSRPHEGLAICKAKTVPSFLMLQWNLNMMKCQQTGRMCLL